MLNPGEYFFRLFVDADRFHVFGHTACGQTCDMDVIADHEAVRPSAFRRLVDVRTEDALFFHRTPPCWAHDIMMGRGCDRYRSVPSNIAGGINADIIFDIFSHVYRGVEICHRGKRV